MTSVAVVLRSRVAGGRNVLVRIQGVELRTAASVAQDAAQILEQAAAAHDPGDVAPVIQGLPLVCGSLTVNRWRVHYRMIGQICAMVITPLGANSFRSLNLLERVVRVVTFDFKSVELSPDRVEKRFPEIYMALGKLLASGGTITAAAAIEAGRSALDSIASSSSRKAAAAAPAAQPGSADGATGENYGQLVTYKGVKRTLGGLATQLPGLMGFSTVDALKGTRPLPGFEPTAAAVQPAMPTHVRHQFALMSATSNEDPFGLPKAAADDSRQKGASKQEEEEDPFALLAPLKPAEPRPPAPVVPASLPVPATPLLRLQEVWRAEVEGQRVVKAGLSGRVTWAPELAGTTSVPAVGFALQYKGSSEAVSDALSSARAHPGLVKPGWPALTPHVPEEEGLAGLTADVVLARQLLAPPVIMYTLHPLRSPLPTPLQASLSASCEAPEGDPHTTIVVLGVQVQLAPQLEGRPLAGLEVQVQLPTLYESPARVSPQGAILDGARQMLTWRVPGPGYGDATSLGSGGGAAAPNKGSGPGSIPPLMSLTQSAHTFSALFTVSAGPAAARAALRSAHAEVSLFSAPGASLTGITLEQHGYFSKVPAVAKAQESKDAAGKQGKDALQDKSASGSTTSGGVTEAEVQALQQRAQVGSSCTSWLASVVCRPRITST